MGLSLKKIGGGIGKVAATTYGGIYGKALAGGSGGGMDIPGVGLSAEDSKKAREKDFSEGLTKGKELIGEGSLGRLSNDQAISQALELQRQRLSGLSGQEMQGARDVATQGINRSTELARRQLAAAQSRAGVRGGVAGAQQSDVQMGGMEQKAKLERDLMMAQRDAQGNAISDVLTSGAKTREFDLSQAAREKFGQISVATGFQQLGVSERSGAAANQAAIGAAQAAAPKGGLFGAITGK